MEFDQSSALIVVDVQNDFASPSGSLSVSGGEDVIEFINIQIAAAAGAGATVVYTQDWHPESTPHFQTEGGIWPVHCVKGTPGAELHPDLDVVDDAVRIKKGAGGEDGYSGFTMRDPIDGAETSTGLAGQLRDRGVKNVAVVGLALDYCVKETALDAVREGFESVLLADGTRPVNLSAGDGARAVAELVSGGVEVA
ncbi:MAG: isochorismatase family protein [Acidimicrobiia bacterium]|nr:isochorismatase family protein [Acidimicrobiia bacterium]